jgi:hypothetical protein
MDIGQLWNPDAVVSALNYFVEVPDLSGGFLNHASLTELATRVRF